MLKIIGITLLLGVVLNNCVEEKYPFPDLGDVSGPTEPVVDDTVYIQQSPVWNAANGYDFSEPEDIFVGREPFLYVADTKNDHITMLDLAGNILGHSPFIPHPIAITQDARLNLLVVNGTNRIYRINLYAVSHQIGDATVDTVLTNPQRDHGSWKFQDISAFNGDDIYVAAASQVRNENTIYIFRNLFDEVNYDSLSYQGPLPLNIASSGIFGVRMPIGLGAVPYSEYDVLFTQRGNEWGDSSFKVQWITVTADGYAPKITPVQPRDIFAEGKFGLPEDVATDENNVIFVVDAAKDSLFRFTPNGDEQFSFGGSGSGDKQFNRPMGVAVFNNTIYVADAGNSRIIRFKLSTDVAQE